MPGSGWWHTRRTDHRKAGTEIDQEKPHVPIPEHGVFYLSEESGLSVAAQFGIVDPDLIPLVREDVSGIVQE